MKRARVSIRDVAELVQVNPSTVSRFFNAPDRLSEATRTRIGEAAKKLGYALNPNRPGPKTLERVGVYTGRIVFLALGEHWDLLNVTAMPILMNCIQRVLLERGLTLEIVYANTMTGLGKKLGADYCDGIIAFRGGEGSERLFKQALEVIRRRPCVWCFRAYYDPRNELDHVLYINAPIGKMAAQYLAERGHRHVAAVNIMAGRHAAFAERMSTFAEEATRHGMTVTPIAMASDDRLPASENNLALADLYLHSFQPTITGAFFCADDLMLSLECALATTGNTLSHLDLIGCNNDLAVLRYLCNYPASIDILMEEIGIEAVNQLLRRINGDRSAPKEIQLTPRLVPSARSWPPANSK